MKNQNPIEIEIWSDIQCPFCYIGKRQLEQALEQYDSRDNVSIEWKSYLLAPQVETQLDRDIHSYIAEKFKLSPDRAKVMHNQLQARAKSVGLTYNFDDMKVINMKAAHRVIQLAKSQGRGNEIEEALFFAHFTENQDLSNLEVLKQMGKKCGLEHESVNEAFEDSLGQWQAKVDEDCEVAQVIGCNGVPFFVINRSQAISGAVGSDAFLQMLNSFNN